MLRSKAEKRNLVLIFQIVCFLFIFLATASNAINKDQFQATLIEHLEYGPAKHFALAGHGLDAESIDRVLTNIYHENALQPLWVSTQGPGESAAILREALKAADSHGLNPEDYRLSKIERYWASTDALGLVRLDILLTLALGRYVADAREGRLNPRKVDPELFAGARDVEIDPVRLVNDALAAPDLKAFLERQLHSNERYEKLRRVLARYREIAAQGGWELIPDGETLKPGMSDWRVPVIRRRLYLTDSLKSDGLSSTAYDEQLVEAVRHFQMRYGLDVDGVLGKETREAMNVPVEAVIRRIIVNMERWRWLPHDLDGVRVGVNIAGFDLGVFKDLRLEMQMPVIVGKTYHKTPIFSDLIKYIEFNPYWNIPPSIARNEMLPRLKQDPRYLVERNIRLFSGWGADARELDSTTVDWRGVSGKQMNRYKFRQDPGLKNALGTVKFMFPNDYNVYLHDTPSHSLFTRPERTFSHGCIRVSKPAELASYLLGGEENGWGIERVMEAINSRKRTVVPLDKPIPIIIAYRTVWLDSEGNVRFNKDVYGRDSILEKALFEDQLWLAPPPKEDVS